MSGPVGLPGPLPPGETLLWQGHPCRQALARDVLHVRPLTIYLAGAVAVMGAVSLGSGRGIGPTALSLAPFAAGAVGVIGFTLLLARLMARATLYAITDRRVVMRTGIALPVDFNLPFKLVDGAGLRLSPDGTGDIPLRLVGSGRIGFLHLWPHVRPWRLGRTEPMLRAVPDAARIARLLAEAMVRAGAPAAAGAEPARLDPARAVPEPSGASLGLPPLAA